ncbi:hypothetical protein U1Q18_021906 [Sarracenia purpurea var. burkii]
MKKHRIVENDRRESKTKRTTCRGRTSKTSSANALASSISTSLCRSLPVKPIEGAAEVDGGESPMKIEGGRGGRCAEEEVECLRGQVVERK